jgi:hypothetical protein
MRLANRKAAQMANAENPAPVVNQDDESRMLLSFLQGQRDAVLKIVEGLPEEDWQKPVVPSGWTVAGMLAHIGGAEYHWFQQVTAGRVPEPQPDEEKEESGYDPPQPGGRSPDHERPLDRPARDRGDGHALRSP